MCVCSASYVAYNLVLAVLTVIVSIIVFNCHHRDVQRAAVPRLIRVVSNHHSIPFRLLTILGSRPSDDYFRSVCLSVRLSVCLFVCAEFFSAVFDPIWIKLGHMLHVRV